MNRIIIISLFLMLFGCKNTTNTLDNIDDIVLDSLTELSEESLLYNNLSTEESGKIENRKTFKSVFVKSNIDSIEFPYISPKLSYALNENLKLLLLSGPESFNLRSLKVKQSDMIAVTKLLEHNSYLQPINMANTVDAFQIWGNDRKGNVKFTGYYAPEIKVHKTRDKIFRYPIYRMPENWEGQLPTRKEIEVDNIFAGKGLEICFAKNPFDIYTMQLQGSGFAVYPDGKKILLSYDGNNGHPFRSIVTLKRKYNIKESDSLSINDLKSLLEKNPSVCEKILHENPSFTFFKEEGHSVRGAGQVKLVSDFSIAVDPKYIPVGSVLLARVPIIDAKGRLIKHEYRILLAQDTGGVILGTGHVDLYCGSGSLGKQKASYLTHYGNLWLLLPKNRKNIVEASIY
jgi:membrane-bound lytic murein transglycosylase A